MRYLPLIPIVLLALPAAAQDDWGEELPCDGVLADGGQIAGVLTQVPKYQSTYVLVFGNALVDDVFDLDSPILAERTIGYYEGGAASELLAAAGLTRTRAYPFELADAGKIVQDVLAGDLDMGLLWAPLAGLAAIELDFNYDLNFRTAGSPEAAPSAFATASATASGSECAQAVDGQLGGYGVVPAEKLVKIDIRSLLHLQPPPRDTAAARQGSGLYAEHCAKCHGPDAVAATAALAPVDLLTSTPRFSYPGFLYIVLNGRSANGMPGFRGTLTREDIRLIYQYARERAYGVTDLASN